MGLEIEDRRRNSGASDVTRRGPQSYCSLRLRTVSRLGLPDDAPTDPLACDCAAVCQTLEVLSQRLRSGALRIVSACSIDAVGRFDIPMTGGREPRN